jgi:hypothetical protein
VLRNFVRFRWSGWVTGLELSDCELLTEKARRMVPCDLDQWPVVREYQQVALHNLGDGLLSAVAKRAMRHDLGSAG